MAIPSKRPDCNADTVLPAVATAVAPTYVEGDAVVLSVDLNGTLRTSAGGGGAGDATAANQDEQTALLTTIDGDTGSLVTSNAAIQAAVEGTLDVNIVSGAGSGGVAHADDADFTDGTTQGTPAMGVYEATPSTVTDGDMGIVGITEDRRLKTSTSIEGGASVGTAGSASADVMTVQGIASMTPLLVSNTDITTIASAIKTEDDPHTSADKGVMLLGVRNDSGGTTLAGTNGDYIPIGLDSSGRVFVNTIGAISTSVNPGTGATNLGKAEDAAHTSSDTGVMMLGVRAASPTDRSAGPTDGDYEPPGINEVGALWTTPTPSANGGLSIFRSLDLDETEEEVKASAGTVYGMWVTNTATSTRFIKFYNATTANVTVGTTTPVITIGIPGNASDDISGNFGPGGVGIGFGTAITAAATTGAADNDTGAPGANEVIVNIFYK